MFRPIPAIIRFASERVSVFTRSMRLCDDGENFAVHGVTSRKTRIRTSPTCNEIRSVIATLCFAKIYVLRMNV